MMVLASRDYGKLSQEQRQRQHQHQLQGRRRRIERRRSGVRQSPMVLMSGAGVARQRNWSDSPLLAPLVLFLLLLGLRLLHEQHSLPSSSSTADSTRGWGFKCHAFVIEQQRHGSSRHHNLNLATRPRLTSSKMAASGIDGATASTVFGEETNDVTLQDENIPWIQKGLELTSPPSHATSPSDNDDAKLNENEASSDTGAVIGPGRVLIYDTTFRDSLHLVLHTPNSFPNDFTLAAICRGCGDVVDYYCHVMDHHVDGTQGESVSASVDDKFKIVTKLALFSVDYIEAGWPGSNPKDAEFFHRAKSELTAHEKSKLVAFGSTCRKRVRPHDDAQVQALLESHAPTICIVAKSHSWQVTDILQASLEENLRMISDTVQYLTSIELPSSDEEAASDNNKRRCRTVMVDMEHFFDGYKSDRTYALQCCEAAATSGASCLVLCDTNGGTMPWDVASICKDVVQHFAGSVTIGIHCHNDCGMAVANSLMGANNGVGLIQGTINGIGERTGNADLCTIIPSLAFHVNKDKKETAPQDPDSTEPQQQEQHEEGGSQMSCRSNLSDLTSVSRYVDEILNRTPSSSAPFVGSSAFAHKGGLHVAAMERSPLSYQHIEPERVGNKKRVLVSELSGRQNILGMMKENNLSLLTTSNEKEMSERAMAIVQRVKDLEAKGYTFEGADASVQLMILHSTKGYCAPFQVLDYTANVYDSDIDSATRVLLKKSQAQARATVKIRTFGTPQWPNDEASTSIDDSYSKESLEVSDGNGPVDALAKALMRALVPSHPSLQTVELIDYKVRILDPACATQAATRVMIEFKDTASDQTWTTVSVDTNVISASLNALVDGYEYALIEHAESCNLCDDDFY